MKSEREVFTIPTMRDIITGMDIARNHAKIQTTNHRYQSPSIKNLEPLLNEKTLAIELEKEKRRFLRQTESLNRTRQKVRKFRRTLLGRIEKNTKLMELRYHLQKQRYQGAS